MGRKNVCLEFIANDSKRKISYMQRKKSLLKNTEELSTLCGVDACAIVYGPNDIEPEIWPSESGLQNVLQKFKSMPEWQQSMNMSNQKCFIETSIMKGKEKVHKLVQDNKKKEMSMFMIECFNRGTVQPYRNMTMADLNVLSSVIDQNLNDISKRLEMFQTQTQISAVQPQMQKPSLEEMALQNYSDGSDVNANLMQSQWCMGFIGNGDETIVPSFGDANLPL